MLFFSVSCANSVHEHTYETDWTSDDTYHWHASTCEHADVISERGKHTWDEGKVTKPATEYEEGETTYTCEVCKKTKTIPIEKLPHTHTFSTEWVYDIMFHWHEATCEHIYEVSERGFHNFGEWSEPDEDGIKTTKCKDCRYEYEEEYKEEIYHEHVFSEEWSYDETYHWHEMSCCYYPYNVRGKASHTFGEWSEPDEDGSKTRKCTVCEYEETGHEHVFSTEWTYDETHHWHERICEHYFEDIGDFSDKGVHNWDEKITIDPTEENDGEKTLTCTVCNKVETYPVKAGSVVIHFTEPFTELTRDIINEYITTETTDVVIEGGFSYIVDNAFKDFSSLESIELPNTIRRIGAYAFRGCTSLISIEIPSSVTFISEGAFYSCTSLRTIRIPSKVTSIEPYTFYNCKSLNIGIPSSITSIGTHAFHGCESLTSVVIPEDVSVISEYAFAYCSSLRSVTISGWIRSINIYAFCGTAITSINLPISTLHIGSYAFAGSALSSITIPTYVSTIGNSAFENCESLSTVIFNDKKNWYSNNKRISDDLYWTEGNAEKLRDGTKDWCKYGLEKK